MKDDRFNPYKYIPFIILMFLLAKFIFSDGTLPWLFNSLKSFFIACIIIYLLNPLVNRIQNKFKLKRSASILLCYAIIFALLALAIVLIVPSVRNSVNALISTLKSESITEIANDSINKLKLDTLLSKDAEMDLLNKLEDIISNLVSYALQFSGVLFNSVTKTISSIAMLFIALFMSFYALQDSDTLGRKTESYITTFFSKSSSKRMLKVMNLTDRAVKDFLIGKIITCIILGFITSISILIVNLVSPLNIPYAPLIGLIIGITNLIPYIGPFIGAIPCIIFALFAGVAEALGVFIIILVAQQIDNIFVSPKILGNYVGLKPFWIVACVTIGGGLFGAMGMVLSVPFAAVIQTLITDAYDKARANNK